MRAKALLWILILIPLLFLSCTFLSPSPTVVEYQQTKDGGVYSNFEAIIKSGRFTLNRLRLANNPDLPHDSKHKWVIIDIGIEGKRPWIFPQNFEIMDSKNTSYRGQEVGKDVLSDEWDPTNGDSGSVAFYLPKDLNKGTLQIYNIGQSGSPNNPKPVIEQLVSFDLKQIP